MYYVTAKIHFLFDDFKEEKELRKFLESLTGVNVSFVNANEVHTLNGVDIDCFEIEEIDE